METILNLINVLESECTLYAELLELLINEKKLISEWNTDKIVEVTKIKDTLLYKEKLLEEAREKIHKKINTEFGEELTLSSIINKINDNEQKEKLLKLQLEIKSLADKIQRENFSVKLLYNTNIKIIGDMFDKIGLTEISGYQSQGKMEKRKNNSFVQSA